MINPKLHTQPVALDREQHKALRLAPLPDWAVAARLNALFIAGVEFGDACHEYPIVFLRAGESEAGKAQAAPVAVFGLRPDDNLYLQGGQWRAQYVPALLRAYPFAIARMDAERYAVCIDMACPGLSQSGGQALFGEDGQPLEFLQNMQQQLQQIEGEIQRTRAFGEMLLAHDLLQDMRFDADLPDGKKLTVDGFLAVDEKRLSELSDADTLALCRNGALGLIHAHQLSLKHMSRLVQWQQARSAGA